MQNIILFIQAHLAVFAALAVAVLDLVFALIPGIESNGIVHMIYLWIKGLVAPSVK